LFSGLLCVFYVLMAASFDGPRPLLVACHWQFCSLANKLRSFIRSFVLRKHVLDGDPDNDNEEVPRKGNEGGYPLKVMTK